jgi:alpha-1,4-digalacturonate transport system substrate-binding protein
MSKRFSFFMLLLLAFVLVFPAAAQDEQVELRFVWYNDGTEGDVMRELLDRFEEANPNITVTMDVLPYATVRDNLRVQVEAGEAPDLARITDFAGSAGFYLDLRPLLEDPALMEDNFNPAILEAFRAGPDDNGLYGFPAQLSVTAPYVNATLFAQAGVEMPHLAMQEPTWEDWLAASREVAEATEVPYVFAIDNKGHRFAAPAMTLGTEFFDDAGEFSLNDDNDAGFREFAMLLDGLIDAGESPAEIWLGGGQFASADQYFSNVQTPLYYSGSWQIGNFANVIGDSFDWIVAPNPYGAGGSTGMAGGDGIVGYAQTEHPEAVAAVMEFLLQPENYGYYAANAPFIPAHEAVVEMGVDFQTETEAAAAALTAFANEVPKFQNQAVAINPHPLAFAYYDASNTRLAQFFAGELTLDQAMQRIQADLDEAAANMAAG